MRWFLVFMIVSFVALPIFVSAQNYYVDINSIGGLCSDSNSGTITEPWCTLAKANSDLQPGDTAYIREGTYGENVNPVNSGSAGNYITFKSYNNEEVIIGSAPSGYGIYLRDKSYINVDGLRTGNMKFWADLRAGPGGTTSHNIIQNCYFDGTKTGGGGWSGVWLGSTDSNNLGDSNYNKIINNTFADVECQPADIIYILFGNARYNLIQDNFFDGGPHVSIELQEMGVGNIEYNVIKNNIIKNELHTPLNVYTGSSWNLVEGNVIRDGGVRHFENWCGSERDRDNPRWVQGGLQLEGSYNIIRRNLLFNNGRNAIENYGDNCDANKVYHNVFYEHNRDWDSNTADRVHENIAKNNIFWESSDYIINHDVQNEYRNNSFINNCLGGNGIRISWWPMGGDRDITYMETTFPLLWYGNIDSDPEFLDPVNRDFRVQSTSLVINSGAFLTTITSIDGSGILFSVDDSRYFMDGWGIIEGDLIQLEGQSQTARITNINYPTHTITVDTTLSWANGQGVSLAYQGSAPDIGAYEYNPSSPPCTGNCRIASCTSYSSCSSSGGSCLNGLNCCSGSCIDTSAPSTPTNLKAIPISTTEIDLAWYASSDAESGVSHYKVYRNSAYIGQTDKKTFLDTGLTPDTTYTYSVSAVNGDDVESSQSTAVSKSTFPIPPEQTGLCQDLVLLQHFDDQTKYGEDFSHVYDYSGTGNDGDCIGLTCPTRTSNGKFGGAFEYDGEDDYFDFGNDGSLQFSNEITLSAWIYSDNYNDYMGILTRPQIFNWFFYVSQGRLGFYTRQTDGSLHSSRADTVLTNGEWYHVAAVYDDSQRTVYFYLNGALDGNNVFADNMASSTWSSLSVGRCYYGTAWQWNGMIDDVAVWNRALDAQEILGIYNSGNPISCGGGSSCVVDGDVDGNCNVTIDDLILVAIDFGKTSGYNSRADTDGNQVIDIFDIVYVARRIP